jgi:hypothetical protein
MNNPEKHAIPFEVIATNLVADDDRNLWRTALAVLTDDFMLRYDEKPVNRDWALVVGACSHWVRPHNSKWDAAGGFIYPEGYLDSMPEFNWSVIFVFRNREWVPATKLTKRLNVLRVAIPTRTVRHRQAVVHSRWSPGSKTVLYGFRKLDGNWECVAASNEETP